ncbi:MAG: hypothetical protein FRX49_09376 [Trebouxia sp. A1-2]|nr:MAG: hypothetical protein FRX49_09376 [Trebouxia sp. A1-2]
MAQPLVQLMRLPVLLLAADISNHAKGTPSTQTVYTEEDFLVKNYRDWGLSDTALRRISKFMVGEPVGSRKFSESELKAAGYTSWTQYQVHAALTAW